MLWQLLAAAVVGYLFYLRRVGAWLRRLFHFRSDRQMGFLFATVYALIASPLMRVVFHYHPVARINDIFVIGIALTSALYTWESAVFLLAIGLLVTLEILPPSGSLRVDSAQDIYRAISFSVLSAFLIVLIAGMKRKIRKLSCAVGIDSTPEATAAATGSPKRNEF